MSAPNTAESVLADKLESLAATLTTSAKDLRGESSTSPNDHAKLVQTLKATIDELKQPRDELSDMMMTFVQSAAIRLFIEWNVFEKIPSTEAISYKDLAAKVESDESLITRLCWILVANGVLKQEGLDLVSHTAKSRPYASVNPLSAMMQMGYDEYLPSLVALPRYFETYGRHEPTGKFHSVKAYAEGQPERTVSDILNQSPKRIANMMLAMTAMEHMFPHSGLYDFVWVAEKAGHSQDRPLIVDVGGAKGFTLQTICRETPGLPIDRCVLEDLPKVIEMVRTTGDDDIKSAQLVPMDYHKEQPIKGALVYFIRRCLHDFGDEDCITILKHLVGAMAPDSRVLIGDTVMSNPPSKSAAMVDFFLSTIGGKERTLEAFKDIIFKAGLTVTGVFHSDHTEFTIIECVKL